MFGLREVTYFELDGYEKLYNNYLGLQRATLFETQEPLHGSTGNLVSYVVLELFLDEFDVDMIESIIVEGPDSCKVEVTEDFYLFLLNILALLFDEDKCMEFAKISANGAWGSPEMIEVELTTENPESFQNQLVWSGRFIKRDILEENEIFPYEDFFQSARVFSDETYELLSKKYGAEE